ncbi:multidrug efflux RND transporter permease subunit LpeB [Legionella oakridgensis]|uniref:Cation/multidrug efflux pump n=2 Tax=Legionella oakridgensis TaxID=29423 RepID=W0BI88_9GAMM|nr:multidrug efflux RND transporter permease subunit LpeB [Legionella oakridgensis]AHE68411.1 cation/multidrug efflux pump [Legionella oakridgensis ATCC 33761 = DSM 21215]KTD38433.1 integral membrane protein, AcrB/AcrD/AcrF family [Legionella oakridgensis]STY21350.1 integral membrane protein, AcrB/AcrD/AcrF family [Legionella longbeachae]
MKLTRYFINHPVIAVLLNGMLVVVGLLCLHHLSVREYPDISFPTITVSAYYPNASPELVESAVTNVLEERLAGIEGLETITSQSNAANSQITLVFRAGTSMDRALNATQDAVARTGALLPSEVKPPIVERQRKSSGLPFIGIALESSSKGFGELTHYANLNLKNLFRSVQGVASVEVWGQPFTYTILLEPEKLYSFGINVDEVITALAKSRISLPSGNYQNKIPSTLISELKSPTDYEDILIKSSPSHPVFLKSVAKVAMETDDSQMRVRVNGHAGLVLSINRANDANPIDVSREVRRVVNHLRQTLPADLHVKIIIDQSDFINASLKNIRSAIGEAVLLVLIIVFLFLRNVRATIIPLITVPISLLGSLLFLKIFGFSINLMTLLAMVLAIGLVVDDAIIVLENIWRHIEKGQSPYQAAMSGAQEIGFAIVAMTLTLASVYFPIAFLDGLLGQLFIEFAVALAGSVFISGLVALTLSPLMCVYFLKRDDKNLWPQFDKRFNKLAQAYAASLQWILQRQKITFLVALISIAASAILYHHIGHETAPKEDRGLIGVYVPAVAGEDINTLDHKVKTLETAIHALPETDNRLTFIGDWGASIILPLKSHAQRKRSASQIVDELRPSFNHYPSIDPHVWSWDMGLPGIDNVGTGSELTLVISSPASFRELFNETEKLKQVLDNSKEFESVNYDLRLDAMGYNIELNHNQIAKLGLTASQVAKTIEVFFSGDKTQNFEKDGVVYNLTVKGSASPWTLDELYLTTTNGKRISLGAITKMTPKAQPVSLDHFQQMRSTTLHVQLHKDDSMAQASEKVWTMAKQELPHHYTLTWTGAAKALKESSYLMAFLFFLSLVFIYAVLSAQFENFIDPFIILFTVPLACSGALLFTYLFGQSLNIYTQVGLITLIGLISKHGILIVEFANQLHQKGAPFAEAIEKAAVLRLRPVLMTTGAMVFGAIPLVLSHDAGAESRHAIGMILISGLCVGTLFTLFILPGVYLIIKTKIKVSRNVNHATVCKHSDSPNIANSSHSIAQSAEGS